MKDNIIIIITQVFGFFLVTLLFLPWINLNAFYIYFMSIFTAIMIWYRIKKKN